MRLDDQSLYPSDDSIIICCVFPIRSPQTELFFSICSVVKVGRSVRRSSYWGENIIRGLVDFKSKGNLGILKKEMYWKDDTLQ